MIIVIGASSFIGTYLVDELVNQGREVFATINSDSGKEYYAGRGITFSRLNIADSREFKRLPKENIETVILLAGLLPANDEELVPRRYIDVNITGTLNVLEYCRINRVKKIIFASSHSDVAALWDCGRPITEEDMYRPIFTGDHAVYVITKNAAMNLVEHYNQAHGVVGISFRLPAVYGYGPHTEIYANGKPIIPGFTTFLRKAMAGDTIEIWGDPSRGRDLVYVKDVVSAFVGAIDSYAASGLYNIASGVRTSLEDEVKGIIEVFSQPAHRSAIRYRPEKEDMPYAYLYDISKAKRDLKYEVRYPLMRMLQDFKNEMVAKRFFHLVQRERKQYV
jgi:UDP-glucose 4-epimerase